MIQLKLTLLALAMLPAPGDLVISANDGKQVLVDGAQLVPAVPRPDSVTVLSLAGGRPVVIGTVEAPASVIGPPRSVAIAPDGSFALVTSARRIAGADRSKLEPDDRVSVIDLRERPIRVSGTVRAGAGASGVAINAAGTLALVANRSEGSVSAFAIRNGSLHPAGKVLLGDARSSPAQPVFFDGGRRALVSRDGDHKISILEIGENGIVALPETLAAGLRPYGIDSVEGSRFAVSANIGGGGRDVDTISLIDLAGPLPRVVDTVAVGLTPEGIKMSPDGRFVAVNVNQGSNASVRSPLFKRKGTLQIWRIHSARLELIDQALVGGWGQGVAWSADGRLLLVQNMIEETIQWFRFDGRKLRPQGSLRMPAGPAALGTSG